MSTPTLVFDLDGTISDPRIGFCRSVNYALRHFGYPELYEANLLPFIGPPIDKTFSVLLNTDDARYIAAVVAKYRERYASIGYAETSLYPGIFSLIEKLAENNVRIGICTSKREDFARKILNMFSLDSYFDFISAGDIGIDKTRQLTDLLHKGIIDTNALMIGDRNSDMIAAKNVGLSSIGVLWGYGSVKELVDSSAGTIVRQPQDIENVLGHDYKSRYNFPETFYGYATFHVA